MITDIPVAQAVVRVQDGDTIIFSAPPNWTADQCAHASDYIRAVVPSGVKVLLLPDGMDLIAVKSDQPQPELEPAA